MPAAGLSYNSILGKFMVFSTDTEVSRKMLSVNDPSSLLMAVHPSAKNILGESLSVLRLCEICSVNALSALFLKWVIERTRQEKAA